MLVELDEDVACRALTSALERHFMLYGTVVVSIRTIPVSNLHSVVARVAGKRLASTSDLLRAYSRADIEPYKPAVLKEASNTILFPPIAEEGSDRLILIDGVHRTLAAHLHGLVDLTVAIARPTNRVPPVAEPIAIDEVKVLPVSHLPMVFAGRDLTYFRPGDLILEHASRLASLAIGDDLPN